MAGRSSGSRDGGAGDRSAARSHGMYRGNGAGSHRGWFVSAAADRAGSPRRCCNGAFRVSASRGTEPDRLLAALRSVETLKRVGRVAEARGTLMRATGVNARIGDVCELRDPGSRQVLTAEVVGIERGMALLTPLGTLEGLSADTEVVSKGFQATVGAGDGLLGRTLDALGNVVDGQPAPANLTP